MKRYMTILGILVSAVLLWLAVRDTNGRELALALSAANPAWGLPILLSLAAFYFLKASRWVHILSSTMRFSAGQLVPSMMAGAAGNNLLPAHIGELVRVYLLGREFSLSKANVLATLIVERIFDIVGVLLLLSTTLIFASISPDLYPALTFLLVMAICGTIVIFLLTRHGSTFLGLAERGTSGLPPGLREKILNFVNQTTRGFEALGKRSLFWQIFINSVVQWICMSGCVYFALQALGIAVPYSASVIVLAIIVAGLTLPTSPGFVGTIQFCFTLGLAPFGVDPSAALAASIFYHVILWSSVTATGLYFLHRYHVSFAQIRTLDSQVSGSGPPQANEQT